MKLTTLLLIMILLASCSTKEMSFFQFFGAPQAEVEVFETTEFAVEPADVDYAEIAQARTDDGGFVLGDPNAAVTIVQFLDFLCPHCQAYKPTINQVIEELVATGQARLELRMLPVTASSSLVFQVAECADEMTDDGFWLAHDEIYDIVVGGTSPEYVGRELAERLDFDYDELLECTETATQWETDHILASAAGVDGTPGVRLRVGNGPMQIIHGYERGGPEFEALLAAVRAVNNPA